MCFVFLADFSHVGEAVVVVVIIITTIFADVVLAETDRDVISLLIITTILITIIIIVGILHLIADLHSEVEIKEIVIVLLKCVVHRYHSGEILRPNKEDLENVSTLSVIAETHQIDECHDHRCKEGKVLLPISNSSSNTNNLHRLIDGHLRQCVAEPIAIHLTGIAQPNQFVHRSHKGIKVQDVLPLHHLTAV